MKNFFFTIIQCTWGFPQTLIGFILFLFNAARPHTGYRGAVVTTWDHENSLSLGLFIFLGHNASSRLLKHEYGHCIQSLFLGPLYLIIVGIPSILWCNVKPIGRSWRSGKRSYYSVFQEKWADNLGHALNEKEQQPADSMTPT